MLFLGVSLLISHITARRQHAEHTLHLTEEKLQAARVIQGRLLPTSAPTLPGFDIAGRSVPANSVGGDYFDFIPLRNGEIGLVVGDVCGHGVGPALVMAETRAYLRALALTHTDVGEILTLVNRILGEEKAGLFLTMFFASLKAEQRRLTYAAAGHAAYLLEPTGEWRRLDSTGLPLAVATNVPIHCGPEEQLHAEQMMLLLTDGVYEPITRAGAPFGVERVMHVAHAPRSRSAAEIVDAIYEASRAWRQPLPQDDDITLIVVKVQPEV
jgi:sigma-B regulation protein RsbU (phosphoserine phosphatase)